MRIAACLALSIMASNALASTVQKYACDIPVTLDPDGRIYSKVIVSTPGIIKDTNVVIKVDSESGDPYQLQLIYGTSPLHLGEFRNDIYMTLDDEADEACTTICANGCGETESGDPDTWGQPQACKPVEGYDFFEKVDPAYHPWQLSIVKGDGELVDWLLDIELEEGGVSKGGKKWGGIFVGISYLILTAAYIILLVQGFRTKSYGMPLIGQAAMLAVTILVVGPGPMLQPCLFDTFIRVPEGFAPGLAADPQKLYFGASAAAWVWRIGLVIQGLVFFQYLKWGKDQTFILEFQKKYFYLTAWGVLALFTLMSYLYIVFYQDYYVNEVYLVATVILAVSYLGSLQFNSNLRGFSVLTAWCWTIGTLLLYIGIVIGHMNEAFHDHLDTGYEYIHALYILAVAFFAAYAVGLTKRYRSMDVSSANRPAL